MSDCTKHAREAIGEGAWRAGSTVLIYQRHRNLDHGSARAAVKKDLEGDFALAQTEFPQFLANSYFFNSCSMAFAKFVSRRYTGPPTSQVPSFTADSVLPAKLFYEVWLASFLFEYEDLRSLAASQRILSTQEYADLNLICYIMRNSPFAKNFGCSPAKRCGLFEDYTSSGFFDISFCIGMVLSPERVTYEVSPALYIKMITLLRATYHCLESGFLETLVEFMIDYPMMTTEELITKYRLDKGAECVAWAQMEQESDVLVEMELVQYVPNMKLLVKREYVGLTELASRIDG